MMSNYTLKRELAEFSASLVHRAKPSLSKMVAAMPCSPGLWRTEEKCHYHHSQQLHCAFAKDAPCEVILLGGVYQKKSERWLAL